jgi:signal transduction histidine kinase
MKKDPVNSPEACESLEPGGISNTGSKASAQPNHSIVLSSLPLDCFGDNEVLERSFEELVRYYRHSSVGSRCLSIVHLMNTPLQVLSFQLDLLEQKAREELELLGIAPPVAVEKLGIINLYRQEKFRQLRDQLEKLQNFARSLTLQGMYEDTQEKSALDLNQVYRQEMELYLFNPIYKHQITREFDFGAGLPLIYGHYIDFSQSFRNIIDNALEAMEGTDHRHLTVVTTCQDKRFTVRIGDTGVGIPPEHLPWIFEPFFTTKRATGGVRAGLGLFMVRRLLAPYKAEIRVDSIPGETWVTVSIPLA